MRKFRSHKVVEAERIDSVVKGPDGTKVLQIDGEMITVPHDFFARGTPQIGDYFVRYPDGYVSWSPRKAFEDGYEELGANGLPLRTPPRQV